MGAQATEPTRSVRLPEPITAELWKRLRTRLGDGQAGPAQVFSQAGIRTRLEGNSVLVRAEPFVYLYALPLVNAQNKPRADAARRLAEDTLADLGSGAREELDRTGTDVTHLSELGRIELELLTGETDPLELIEQMCSDSIGAFRVGMRWGGWLRLAFWQILDQLMDGVEPETVGFGDQVRFSELLNGLPEFIATNPTMTTEQPQTMPLLTASGANLVFTCRAGGGFTRPVSMPAWPVGLSPAGVYNTRTLLTPQDYGPHPEGHAAQLLADTVDAANRALGHFTDPSVWADGEGVLDIEERDINWASFRFGLDAVRSIAGDYSANSSLWEAFRALGTLQGIWEGPTGGSVPLGWLFDPTFIRAEALPAIGNEEHRRWAAFVVDNLARGMSDVFGSTEPSAAKGPCEAARAVANIRNLVHGAGEQSRKRPRRGRLDLVRFHELNNANLALVKELAGIWWCAALNRPDRLLVSGFRPSR